MKLSFAFLFSALFLLSAQIWAQDSVPVQLSFKAKQLQKGKVVLSIHAKTATNTTLLAPVIKAADNPFVSSLLLDSAYKTVQIDSIILKGNWKTIQPDTALPAIQVADSAIIEYVVSGVDSFSLLSGNFNWLIRDAEGGYPAGSKIFKVKVEQENDTVKSATVDADISLWSTFLLCFITGLLAIITPCVFPLIPVTVSFFLKRSGSRSEGIRNAVIYSFSIISIYTIPTLLLTLIFGETILYTIATSALSNLLFFVIFLLFAISFFGAFELTLPNSWANKADAQAGKGGFMGTFFMALTLVIVSFSCTGPLVGTLLGKTSMQGVSAAPIIGMFGFGCGLALPFSLFAFFPTLLKSLPKSGGWLNSVKVSFGFIELALALKFLSNVDLIYHWHLLDRDVFLALWIVIFGLLGMYLLGKLQFSHDSPLKYIPIPRLFFAIASFWFAIYMFPGLWGAQLPLLSGFLPPAASQSFNLDNLQYKTIASNDANHQSNTKVNPPQRYTDKLHVPFGLTAYFDLQEGLAAAKALKKPVMLDFTGHSCANCRKMEEQVWKNPEVLKRIREQFVLVSLYVDESTELPENEQYVNAKGEKITTVGEKNLDYEIAQFGVNAQPLYMFTDVNGQPLSKEHYGYNANINMFIQHLDKMVKLFEKK